MLSLEDERDAWVIYGNLHVLSLGGVPESKDMRNFAPLLWAEQTVTPAVYFVWNDKNVDPNDYIKKRDSLGRCVLVNELTESPPDESAAGVVRVDADAGAEIKKAELWATAKAKLVTRGKMYFDTGGLSAHGIVPRF